jgi:hypothetical protein
MKYSIDSYPDFQITQFGRKTSVSLSTEEEDKSRAGSPTGQSGARRQQQKKPKKKKQA